MKFFKVNYLLRIISGVVVLSVLSACQKMEATEYGVRFRRLPPLLGGGVGDAVISPGEVAIVYPWDAIYRFDTSVRDISWGKDLRNGHGDYVNTRALDGNEVALAVTIRYRISPEAEKLVRLVSDVATSDEEVRELVASVGRADVRHYMNELKTAAFLDEKSRYEAVDKVKSSMEKRLGAYGIEVVRVGLDDFRFERLAPTGEIDSSYQDKLTEIQKLREDTERERSRIDTVKAKKQQEFNVTQATVNRKIAEAEGYKKQAELRGVSYFSSRGNEAQGILAQGKAEVQGLIEQINALNGPGGEAILRLELAKQLMRSDPRFVVMNSGKDNGIAVQRIDTNDLLKQAGVFEALQGAANPKSDRAKDDDSVGTKTNN